MSDASGVGVTGGQPALDWQRGRRVFSDLRHALRERLGDVVDDVEHGRRTSEQLARQTAERWERLADGLVELDQHERVEAELHRRASARS